MWEMIKIIRVCNIQRTIKKESSRGVLQKVVLKISQNSQQSACGTGVFVRILENF